MKQAFIAQRSLITRTIVVLLASAATSCVLSAGAFRTKSLATVAKKSDPSVKLDVLDTIRTGQGFTRRSIVRLPGGECVVLNPPMKLMSLDNESNYVLGDFATADDDLEYCDKATTGMWHVEPDNFSELSTFNCATFAIGESIGLTKSDWLEPTVMDWTRGSSPSGAVLKSYYILVATYSASELDSRTLDDANVLRASDVVAFVDSEQTDGFIHFGRVVPVDGHLTLASKFGQGPILHGSVYRTSLRYKRKFDEIRVYRRITKGRG